MTSHSSFLARLALPRLLSVASAALVLPFLASCGGEKPAGPPAGGGMPPTVVAVAEPLT